MTKCNLALVTHSSLGKKSTVLSGSKNINTKREEREREREREKERESNKSSICVNSFIIDISQ